MEPGVAAVAPLSYPAASTEPLTPFAELQFRVHGDIRQLGPENHMHHARLRIVPDEGSWRPAW